MLGASHGDNYIRAKYRMRKMDMTHDGREMGEYAGNTFKSTPQIVGKNFKGRLINQWIRQSDSVCVRYYNPV